MSKEAHCPVCQKGGYIKYFKECSPFQTPFSLQRQAGKNSRGKAIVHVWTQTGR